MKFFISLTVAALSLAGATAASAQDHRVPRNEARNQTVYSQCYTDEGYGRRGSCDYSSN